MNDDRSLAEQQAVAAELQWKIEDVADLLVDGSLPLVHVDLVDVPVVISANSERYELLAALLCEV